MALKDFSIGNRGDTIVEVLIAIAVVSSVLGISYSIMNRNVSTIRDNQERSAASKIAQVQLEYMRQAWYTKTEAEFSQYYNQGPHFCLNSGLERRSVINPTLLNDTGYPGATDNVDKCRSGIYHYSVTKSNDASLSGSYTVTVRWEKLTGGQGQIVMGYRVQ